MDFKSHGKTHHLFSSHAILIITFAQLFGTSLWFSANSAAANLIQEWHITVADIGWLTNAVQAGFILGTFFIAFTGFADRFKASSIFTGAALLGALFNLCFAWLAQGLIDGMIYRFYVGICLAGIYPIGMKLVVQWAPHRAGAVLSILVAMLTLGTALPHALNGLSANLNWHYVITFSSILASIAALLIFMLGDDQSVQLTKKRRATGNAFQVFKIKKFKASALGYFGHMWELYAFWTILPVFITHSGVLKALGLSNVPLATFLIMACGAVGCLLGGYWSKKYGSDRVAMGALFLSGLCCLIFALGWRYLPAWSLLIVLVVWSASVIADSPQFSALASAACPPEKLGAALSIQNSIGFAITIVSIASTTYAFDHIGLDSAWILLLGPVLGILGFYRTMSKTE
jgi:MFS family permease